MCKVLALELLNFWIYRLNWVTENHKITLVNSRYLINAF